MLIKVYSIIAAAAAKSCEIIELKFLINHRRHIRMENVSMPRINNHIKTRINILPALISPRFSIILWR